MKAIIQWIILPLTILFSYPIEIQAQNRVESQKMTFEEAWSMTNQNSHAVKQVEYLRLEKDLVLVSARGLYFPKVGLTASYMAMSQDLTLDLTPVKNAITPLYSTLATYGNFSGVPNPDPKTNQGVPILSDNLSTLAVRSKLNDGLTQIQNTNWEKMIQKKQFGVVAATFQWPVFVGGKIAIANTVARIERKEAD